MNRNLRLLLVEDNPIDVHLFKLLMKEFKTPYELKQVPDGAAAIDYVINDVRNGVVSRPDLIFLDLNLPKRNGKEVLKEIKDHPSMRSIPIVILSTSTNRDDIQDCYELHANCYISKPSNMIEFKRILKTIEEFWFNAVALPSMGI